MTLPQLKSVPSLVFDRAAAKKRNDLGGHLKKLKVCAADIAYDLASDICFIPAFRYFLLKNAYFNFYTPYKYHGQDSRAR